MPDNLFSFERSRGRVWEGEDARENALKELKQKQRTDRKHRYRMVHLAGGGWVVERAEE